MLGETTQSRVAHPFARVAKGSGIARSATALLLASTAITAAHALNASCGITQPPAQDRQFFPPIAKAAHVSGEIVLLARFDQQGGAQVSKVLSGPEMLKESATAYIEASMGEKSEEARECEIVISFNLEPGGCEPTEPVRPFKQFDSRHVEIYGTAQSLCDPAAIYVRHHFLFFHWNTTT